MTIVVDNDPEIRTIDYIAFNKQLRRKKVMEKRRISIPPNAEKLDAFIEKQKGEEKLMTKEEATKAKKIIDKKFSKMIAGELKWVMKAYEDNGTVYQDVSYLMHRLGSITKQWDDMNRACDKFIDEY